MRLCECACEDYTPRQTSRTWQCADLIFEVGLGHIQKLVKALGTEIKNKASIVIVI